MAYPPAGGGKLDPKMAREFLARQGTYPPRSISTGDAVPLRNQALAGYNQHTFGDIPQGPPKFRPQMISNLPAVPASMCRSSTAPRYDDPGYPILQGYPSGSRMDMEYKEYKSLSHMATTKTKKYTKESLDRAVPNLKSNNGKAYGRVKNKHHFPEHHLVLEGLAKEAKEAAGLHSQARTTFNQAHIGRMARDKYYSHVKEADNAKTSGTKHEGYEALHKVYKTMPRYPTSDNSSQKSNIGKKPKLGKPGKN